MTIAPLKIEFDSRGNKHEVPDMDNLVTVGAWVWPSDGAKAEVNGQITINTIRVGTKYDIEGVSLESRVEFMDKRWDIVAPPKPHYGVKRHTRHWSFTLRERP